MAKSFNAMMADRFTKIRTDAATINKYVHDTAVMIAKHAAEHRDCSTAQGLVMTMPASFRREMLILWFTKFTPIVVKNADGWTAKMHKEDSKLFVPFDVEAGEATPFYELARQNKERAPLDFAGLVLLPQKLAKQLQDRIDNELVTPAELETAKSLVAALKGIRVQHVNINVEAEPAEGEAEDAAAAATAAAAAA